MTANKRFKKQVRFRMTKTGETYMQARACLLKGVSIEEVLAKGSKDAEEAKEISELLSFEEPGP